VLVWRLDRWGRSLLDLVTTLQELTDLNIGFVSLSEALDLTTSTGRAMAGMLSVFAAFETRYPSRPSPRRTGPCPAKRHAPWPTRHSGNQSSRSPKTIPPGSQ
jgi:hypothetical protein